MDEKRGKKRKEKNGLKVGDRHLILILILFFERQSGGEGERES